MQRSSRHWPFSRWCSSWWVSGGPGSSSGHGTPVSPARYARPSPAGPALPPPPARPPRRTDRAGWSSRAPEPTLPPLPPYEPSPVPGPPSRRLEQPRHAAGEFGIVARDLDDLAPGPTSRDDAHRPPGNVELPGQGPDHRLVGPAVDGPFAHPDHDCPVMAAAHCLAGRPGPHMDCHLHGTATRSVLGTASPVAVSQIARWGEIWPLPSPLRIPGSVTGSRGGAGRPRDALGLVHVDPRARRAGDGQPGAHPAAQSQRLPAAMGRRGHSLRPGRRHAAPAPARRWLAVVDPEDLHHPLPRRPLPRTPRGPPAPFARRGPPPGRRGLP